MYPQLKIIVKCLACVESTLVNTEQHMHTPPSEKSRFRSFFGLDSGI